MSASRASHQNPKLRDVRVLENQKFVVGRDARDAL